MIGLPQVSQKRVHNFILIFDRHVLCFWAVDTLDPCSDGDINNDLSSL